MTTFDSMGLKPELLQALADMGFSLPTPVQQKAIPHILGSRQDLIALARTGTGKTAAFSLPILSQIEPQERQVQALILCPTRELCLQISKAIEQFMARLRGASVVAVYGGEPIARQIRALADGANIVVGTPGRVIDLMERKRLNFGQIRWLVLDEADEMLDMGFKDELNAILAQTPPEKQTLLFSATLAPSILGIAQKYMRQPLQIKVEAAATGAGSITHEYYVAHAKDRYHVLRRMVDMNPDIYGIVFCRTKQETEEVATKLIRDHYSAQVLNGDLSQDQREAVMGRFRKRQVQLLVATDVAARGIDVNDLTHVINYNLPESLETYVHRSGRTGRAGGDGHCLSIIHMRERGRMQALERKLGKRFEQKKIPAGKDICERQLLHLIDRVKRVEVSHAQIEPYMEAVHAKLEGLDREALIKHFVSLEFSRFLEFYKDAPDLNASAGSSFGGSGPGQRDGFRSSSGMGSGSFARFKMNAGSQHGLMPKDILGLLNSHPAMKQVNIGKIKIMEGWSFFEVDSADAHAVPAYFKSTRFKKGPVTLALVKSG